MNFKGNYINPALFVAGLVLGVIGHNWASTMNKGMNVEPKKDPNDVRIEQHRKCLDSGMKSELDREYNLICKPSAGIETLREYWDRRDAEKVIAEKTGSKQKKDTGWPVDPNSFETKSKRTE